MLRRWVRRGISILIAAAAGPLWAQDPAWVHTTATDPLTGKVTEQFVLSGAYLAPPVLVPTASLALPPPPSFVTRTPPQDVTPELEAFISALSRQVSNPTDVGTPKLVLACSEGNLVRHFGLLRGQLRSPAGLNGKLDMVVDAGQKKSRSVPMAVNADRSVVDDRITYTSFDIEEFVPDILQGKTVTLVARMDAYGSVFVASPLHQVLMEFVIPDPEPIYTACGVRRFVLPPPALKLPDWQHQTIKDPLTETVVERFILEGDYLEPPPGVSPVAAAALGIGVNDRPKLVFSCSDGKLLWHYGLMRGYLISINGSSIEKIDMVVDAHKKKSVSMNVGTNKDPSIPMMPTDRNLFAFELNKFLPDILNGKTVTLVARPDYTNNIVVTRPQGQTLTEFQMPSPAPILSSCGADKLLQGVKQ